jgi:2'-5' RNA ligase
MKTHRLFFALWPPAQVRESIVKTSAPLLDEMDGRIIQAKNLHITLHFIGSVTEGMKVCIDKSAQSVMAKPFDISLDCYGYFSKAKIFWMAAQALPPELSQLHQNLGEALSVCDFYSEQRPYSPHVSLLRKAGNTAIAFPEFSINWHVDEFVLLESSSDADGVSYKVIETYPIKDQGY